MSQLNINKKYYMKNVQKECFGDYYHCENTCHNYLEMACGLIADFIGTDKYKQERKREQK